MPANETIMESRISCGYGNARPAPYLYCVEGNHWLPEINVVYLKFCPECGRKVKGVVYKSQDELPTFIEYKVASAH